MNLLGCAKANEPSPDSQTGCCEIVRVPVSAHSISTAEVAPANTLFGRNGINFRNFRYCRYDRGPFQTQFPPYATYDEQLVRIKEYTNGLPVFTGESNFIFWNGIFHCRAGEPTTGTSLGSAHELTAGRVRALFLASIERFDRTATSYQNRCMRAEFGYYNLNAGISYASENLVKAWKVTPKNAEYPFAYYRDADSQLIYYDNGIRTFR